MSTGILNTTTLRSAPFAASVEGAGVPENLPTEHPLRSRFSGKLARW